MATNYIQRGDHITLTATAAMTSGAGFQTGNLFGVVLESVASGAPFDVATEGVWTLPSDGSAFTLGSYCYWNAATSQITPTQSGSLLKVGVTTQALASGGATINVRLNGAF
jgi:predicted RecA/RadA family phage recombinase